MMAIRSICMAALIAWASADASAQPIPLRYGQTASTLRSVFSLPIFVAEREGFFAAEGLAVTVVPINGGTDKMIAALNDASVDVTHVSMPFLIQANLDGADSVAIAAEFNNPIYSLVVKPEIRTFADLKGRQFGMAVAADTIAISIRRLLAKNGLSDRDFRVKEMVGTPVRFNCLKQGECDGVPLGQPEDFMAVDMGYRILGISSDAVPDFLYTVTAVRKSWADAHKETVGRYVKALAAAFRFIRDPARRDAVVKTIVETTDASEAIARAILKLYFEPDRGVLPKQGEISLAGLSQVIAFMREGGAIKGDAPPAARFVDLQYLKAAGVQ